MIKVVFVCLGNICRSPMAEGLFKKLVQDEGLADQFTVDSAATGSWNLGNPPHRGTQQVLKKYHVDTSGMRARKINRDDYLTADYIIGMDENNLADIEALRDPASQAFVSKLMDFVSNPEKTNIPDPYYTGDFEETERLITAGVKGLLATIRREKQL